MGIDFVILPYNDFLKGENLGFRDRDLHLILEIIKDEKGRKSCNCGETEVNFDAF
jgi:hypothetical protein